MLGIIFDLDGVLWDSTAAHALAYRLTLEAFAGIQPQYAAIAGVRTDEAIRSILDGARVPYTKDLIERLVAEKRRRALAILRETRPLIEGCQDAVRRLSARWPLALATSASHETAETFFALSGLRECFSVSVCGPDVARGKPAADLILLSCERLGLRAPYAALVEDSANGVKAGRAAGVKVLGVLGTHQHDALVAAGAAAVAPDLAGVVETLERWAWRSDLAVPSHGECLGGGPL